jgi:phenylpropionate dioxygenase-like ring-hydroxylating dioxygenase large terminal subunit
MARFRTRDGDHIVCGYHGLIFDGSGQCVRNP